MKKTDRKNDLPFTNIRATTEITIRQTLSMEVGRLGLEDERYQWRLAD